MGYDRKKYLEGKDMVKKVGLSIYGISLYNSESEKNINLNDVLMSKSLLGVIKDCIDENGNKYKNDRANERLYKFDNIEFEDIDVNGKKEYTVLSGIIKTGEYGIQSELVDVVDNSTVEKKSTQAEIQNFSKLNILKCCRNIRYQGPYAWPRWTRSCGRPAYRCPFRRRSSPRPIPCSRSRPAGAR